MRQSYYRALALTMTVLLQTASGLSSSAFGQTARPVPENAQASRYGSGWTCNGGFRRQDDTCFEVQLPDNAFLTNSSFGNGWDCTAFSRRGIGASPSKFRPMHISTHLPATAGDACVDTVKPMWVATLLRSRRKHSCPIPPQDPAGNAKEVIARHNKHASSSNSPPTPI